MGGGERGVRVSSKVKYIYLWPRHAHFTSGFDAPSWTVVLCMYVFAEQAPYHYSRPPGGCDMC